MRNKVVIPFIVLAIIIAFEYCKEGKLKEEQVSLICLRDFDTLHIKIFNGLRDTIYVPSTFTGTFIVDSDTLLLETFDKPEYNSAFYYRYSNIFPFEFYTAKKIYSYQPDTTLEIKYQTNYFNQFRLNSFKAIYPDSSVNQKITFSIPQRASIVRMVYYTKSYHDFIVQYGAGYTFHDFIKFDSLNAKYSFAPILNRFYIK